MRVFTDVQLGVGLFQPTEHHMPGTAVGGCIGNTRRRDADFDPVPPWRDKRVAGKSVRKYTLRRYSFFFKEIEAKSAEFSTPS